METYKIGEEISFSEEFEIESALSGNKLTVKAGDKGYLDSRGNIHYTTGQARGKIQSMKNEIEVKGYHYENIARMIFKRLDNQYRISEFLDDYDISMNDFRDEIEDVLSDIL